MASTKDGPRILLSEPFLVLWGKPQPRPGRPLVYDLRLVNPTTAALEGVETSTDGFYSDTDDGVVEATGKGHRFGDVPSGGSVTIEEPDIYELSDFVISWTVSYAKPPKVLRFSLFKDRDGVPIDPVPVLGGQGVAIPRV